MIRIGEQLRLQVLAIRSDKSVVAIVSGIEWKSSNPSVATVAANGVVEGKELGTVSITAEVGAVSGAAKVEVSAEDPSDDFAVVVLPDTQFYNGEALGGSKGMFHAQTWWIQASAGEERIRAVVGVGDIVNCSKFASEWENAKAGFGFLLQSGIPFAPMLGNHDYDFAGTNCGPIGQRGTAAYDAAFGPTYFGESAWYGKSTFPVKSNANFYITFEHKENKYLVLLLEFYPRDEALDWAKSVIGANLDRQVIVATHAYLTANGTRIRLGELEGPQSYGAQNDGEVLWTRLLSKYPNIIAVVSGHFLGVASRVDAGDGGNLVAQMLSNYQGAANGGNGFLRVLRISPGSRVIRVRTYSPYLDQSLGDEANDFSISYGSE